MTPTMNRITEIPRGIQKSTKELYSPPPMWAISAVSCYRDGHSPIYEMATLGDSLQGESILSGRQKLNYV